MDEKNSDTPRTNAAVNEVGKSGVDWHYSATLMATFARQMERELNANIAGANSLQTQLTREQERFARERDELRLQLKEAKEIISHFGWTSCPVSR